jgi:hypothetical protein
MWTMSACRCPMCGEWCWYMYVLFLAVSCRCMVFSWKLLKEMAPGWRPTRGSVNTKWGFVDQAAGAGLWA